MPEWLLPLAGLLFGVFGSVIAVVYRTREFPTRSEVQDLLQGGHNPYMMDRNEILRVVRSHDDEIRRVDERLADIQIKLGTLLNLQRHRAQTADPVPVEFPEDDRTGSRRRPTKR